MSAYLIFIITLIAIWSMVALAYALPVGYAGMLHLGHIGLFGVGAYTAALLIVAGAPFWVVVPAAGLAGGAVGFLLALPARRIKAEHYALITLGALFVIFSILLNWISVTRGPFGVTGIHRPDGFAEPASFLALVAAALVVMAAFVHRVTSSPFGKALEAVRDDDLVAESLGKPVAKLRIACLVVSAVLVGIAGAFYAPFLQFINTQLFWLDNAVWVLAALVIGGLASFPGALIGMAALFLIFEPIRFIDLPLELVGPLRFMIFSLLLLLVVLFRPKGLLGRAQLD